MSIFDQLGFEMKVKSKVPMIKDGNSRGMGTMYRLIPKVRNGGYIAFFVTERKRSDATLIQVVQEVFVQGVSTRKMDMH